MANVAIDINRELVDACKRGEQSAFHQLYRLYSKAMFNAALRIVKDVEEAEDVLQEGFVSAFKNIASYKGDSTFGAWLKRIIVNKAISELRKKHHQLLPLEDIGQDVCEQEDVIPDYDIKTVKKAIEELPDGYRIVLSLYLLEGYDHNEIAEVLGITVSTSKSQYNRAKGKLRSMLNKKEVYYG